MITLAFLVLYPLAGAGETSCKAGSATCDADTSALLQKAVKIESHKLGVPRPADHRAKGVLRGNSTLPCNLCEGKPASFQYGKEVPFWEGRTCCDGEAEWACESPVDDEGRLYLIQMCCEEGYPDWAKDGLVKDDADPDLGKCLCGAAGSFHQHHPIPGWEGRTCVQGELDWACSMDKDDPGVKYLRDSCCGGLHDDKEDDQLPKCFGDCPMDGEITCVDIREWLQTPHGCLSDCSMTIRQHLQEELKLCGDNMDGSHDCYNTCPMSEEAPSCEDVMTFANGCAQTCPEDMKEAALDKFCGPISGGHDSPISGGSSSGGDELIQYAGSNSGGDDDGHLIQGPLKPRHRHNDRESFGLFDWIQQSTATSNTWIRLVSAVNVKKTRKSAKSSKQWIWGRKKH